MRTVTVAATQMRCSDSIEENIVRAEGLVRRAAAEGAQIILLQELFETPYFCQVERADYYSYALELENNRAVHYFKAVAKELGVVLPISFYEKKNNARYNALTVLDADGESLGVYRKSHIPDGPGYEEKFYFNPGDTGFRVFKTKYATIGVGICWDQWFPEAARIMALMGAELLLYPTAIGSEPERPDIDSKAHWQRCMVGHAACNLVPVVASNRIGEERAGASAINFYGSSFITGATGEVLSEAGRSEEAVLTATFDLDALEAQRADLYGAILTYDGVNPVL